MDGILTNALTKNYGSLCAVDGLTLKAENEIYGLLGPNGSGKTTTVRMLTTLLSATSGSAEVCGYDIAKEKSQVRSCISYVPQDMAVDIRLTGRENVDLFAKLYGIRDKAERKRIVADALEVVNLTDRADSMTKTYSGGMKRRLELAQALVHQPQVLFLDEPTIGLDVASRRTIWEHITKLKKSGMTILVTTHQMEEAERYCNKVGIIRRGKLIKEGAPAFLKADLKKEIITVKSDGNLPQSLPEGVTFIETNESGFIFSADKGSNVLPELTAAFEAEKSHVIYSSVREPNLEDVYMQSCGDDRGDNIPFDDRQFRNLMTRR